MYIDDATGRLMELYFARSEATFDPFEATQRYLRAHGKPEAFYSDKASIFRVNAKDPKAGDGFTQFARAMFDLNIDTICRTGLSKSRASGDRRQQAALLRELALARQARDQATAAGGSDIDQLVAEAVARLAMAPSAPVKRRPTRAKAHRGELSSP